MDVRHFKHFADLVKALRRQNKLSQRALAKTLSVSPGYIGQWELKLSQPSSDVTFKLCRLFGIDAVEFVQRLAYAQRAPQWLRESIVCYATRTDPPVTLSPTERRILQAVRSLSDEQAERLADRIEGWVDAVANE